MLNSRKWTFGLSVALIGSGVALGETPTMRSILRRPAPQSPAAGELAQAPAGSSERKFNSPITLPRARGQAENPREAQRNNSPADQIELELPEISIDFNGARDSSFVPTPAVDTGDQNAPATRPIFDAPQLPDFDVVGNGLEERQLEGGQPTEDQPATDSDVKTRPIPAQFPPNYVPPRPEGGGVIQRWRMRRSGASNPQPKPPAKPTGNRESAIVKDEIGPSILDIEMPADAVTQPELRTAKVASPVNFEVPAAKSGPKPLFSTR